MSYQPAADCTACGWALPEGAAQCRHCGFVNSAEVLLG